jgi:hypothetical protein
MGIVIVAYKFPQIDNIVLRKFYELSLYCLCRIWLTIRSGEIPFPIAGYFLQLGFLIINYFETSMVQIRRKG